MPTEAVHPERAALRVIRLCDMVPFAFLLSPDSAVGCEARELQGFCGLIQGRWQTKGSDPLIQALTP